MSKLSLLLVVALIAHVTALSCLDNNGKKVPWWFMYKLPRMKDESDTRVQGGFGFAYMDNKTPAEGSLSLYPTQMDDTKNPIALTRSLSQLVGSGDEELSLAEIQRRRNLRTSSSSNKDISFMMYNDQPDNGKSVSAIYGHSKGVVAFDGDSGIWMPHSTPEFPSTSKKADFWFPQSETIYGQYFFCISLTKDSVEDLANQMMYVHPYIFYDGFSAAHKEALPTLTRVLNKERYKEPGTNLLKNIKAVGDSETTFMHFAKNDKWGGDLWSEFVATELKQDLWVETWIRGSAVGEICDKPYTLDVESLEMYPPEGEEGETYQWTETQDHSKWAVGTSKTKQIFCFGDINRMTTQRKRGGGALCWKSAAMWNRMYGAIVDVENCD